MQASIETLSLIRAADDATTTANKSGVTAVLSLIKENIGERFPHGSAAELSAILRDGKVSTHSAKRYADLCAMAVKAIAHQASLASAKAKPAEKTAAKAASIDASLAELAGMASMVKVRQWSKENGPKGDKVKASDAPQADAPQADAPQADAPSVEAMGQLREIRECLAMINSGQCQPGEALAAIAGIVGVTLTQPAKSARTRAKLKAAA